MAAPQKNPTPPFHQDPEFWRKQTYFLVLMSLVYLAVMMAPLAIFTGSIGEVVFSGTGYVFSGTFNVDALPMPGIISGFLMMGAILSLFTVLRFRARKQQASLARVKFLFSVAVNAAAWGISYFWVKGGVEAQDPATAFMPGWGLYVLPLTIILSFLSLRGVLADIKRVRSSERFW